MSDQEEWGPWIDHDGNPAPNLQGLYMRVRTYNGRDEEGCMRATETPPDDMFCAWVWSSIPREFWGHRIIRYRIRKPRAISQLQEMIREMEGEPA